MSISHHGRECILIHFLKLSILQKFSFRTESFGVFYPLFHTSRMFQHSVQSFLLNHSFFPTVVLLSVFPRNVTAVFDTVVAFGAVDVNKQVTAEAGTKWHL